VQFPLLDRTIGIDLRLNGIVNCKLVEFNWFLGDLGYVFTILNFML